MYKIQSTNHCHAIKKIWLFGLLCRYFLLAFIISSIIWGQRLVQPVLPEI